MAEGLSVRPFSSATICAREQPTFGASFFCEYPAVSLAVLILCARVVVDINGLSPRILIWGVLMPVNRGNLLTGECLFSNMAAWNLEPS